MTLFEYEGKRPVIAPDAFVAPTASIIGDVTIETGASVWYGCVLRGDDGPIVVRERANVQDLSLLHSFPDTTTEIGPGATVAHRCIVHGAVLEEEALVGNGAIVLDNARIGARSMVGAGSLVTPGTQIPPGVLALGSPCKVKGPIAGTPAEMWVRLNPVHYPALAQRHRDGIKRLD